MSETKKSNVTISFPLDKRKALNKMSAKTGIPVAAIIRNLVYEKLEKTEAA